MIVVRPFIAWRSPSRIRASVVASTAAVASSRIRIRGSRTSARAIATLPLAARERDPALADHRVVTLGEVGDELVRLREARCPLDVLVAGLDQAEGDVLLDRRGEEEGSARRCRSRAEATGFRSRTSTPSIETDPAVTS